MLKIGKNCVIGAKSLITENKEIPDNSLVVGSTIIRKVTDEEVKATKRNTLSRKLEKIRKYDYQDNMKKILKNKLRN